MTTTKEQQELKACPFNVGDTIIADNPDERHELSCPLSEHRIVTGVYLEKPDRFMVMHMRWHKERGLIDEQEHYSHELSLVARATPEREPDVCLEERAFDWLRGRCEHWYNEHPNDVSAFDADQMVDAFMAGYESKLGNPSPDNAALVKWLKDPELWRIVNGRCDVPDVELDWIGDVLIEQLQEAALTASPRPSGDVIAFAETILHGDEVHQEWLREAAQAWVSGNSLPAPRSGPRPSGGELVDAWDYDDEEHMLAVIEVAWRTAGISRTPFFGEAYEPGQVVKSIVEQYSEALSAVREPVGDVVDVKPRHCEYAIELLGEDSENTYTLASIIARSELASGPSRESVLEEAAKVVESCQIFTEYPRDCGAITLAAQKVRSLRNKSKDQDNG